MAEFEENKPEPMLYLVVVGHDVRAIGFIVSFTNVCIQILPMTHYQRHTIEDPIPQYSKSWTITIITF